MPFSTSWSIFGVWSRIPPKQDRSDQTISSIAMKTILGRAAWVSVLKSDQRSESESTVPRRLRFWVMKLSIFWGGVKVCVRLFRRCLKRRERSSKDGLLQSRSEPTHTSLGKDDKSCLRYIAARQSVNINYR